MPHTEIKETLDSFILEQRSVNDSQNKALSDIKISVADVVTFYNGSSRFFKVTMKVALYIGAIAIAITSVWALIKFVVLTAVTIK